MLATAFVVATDGLHRTPCHSAASGGRCRALLVLLQVDPLGLRNADDYRNTPLMFAIEDDRTTMVHQLLLQYAPEFVVQDAFGTTALHFAIELSKTDMVTSILRRYPAGFEVPNGRGMKPIDYALWNDRRAMADEMRLLHNGSKT